MDDIAIIVEDELDAMLIIQEARNLCSYIALEGAQKRPDDRIYNLLKTKNRISPLGRT